MILHALLFYDEQCKQRTDATFTANDWLGVTHEEFEEFHENRVPHLVRRTMNSSATVSSSSDPVTRTQVQSFLSTHRRDIKAYKSLMSL